ncbi:unnamed protein product [Amaranthus hypochondriacus]
MGIQLIEKMQFKKFQLSKKMRSNNSSSADVPKGHIVVYIGETCKTRHIIPISYLNHPLFQHILHLVEQEYGFQHPMGGLTIPCSQEYFASLTSIICSS